MSEGNATASLALAAGDAVSKIPVEPTRDGYEFLGWYRMNNAGSLTAKWWAVDTMTYPIYEDDTVYAKWEEVPDEPVVKELKGKLYVNLQDENGTLLGGTDTPIVVTNSYTVSAESGADYTYPATITYNGDNYIYEGPTDYSAPLTGTVTKDGQNFVVVLQYTKDNWNDKDDEETGGDNIPDYKQAVVKFQSADVYEGTVSGKTVQVFTLARNNAGQYAESKTPETVATNPAEGYAFDVWTKDPGTDAVNPFVSQELQGGQVVTYVAHFDTNVVNEEDNIPDKYEAVATYKVVNGTWDGNNAQPQNHVFLLKEYKTDGKWHAVSPAPVLGTTIPTGMVPNAGYLNVGEWDTDIGADTAVTGNVTYIYTFTTAAAPSLEITKVITAPALVNGELPKVKVGDTITWTITVTNDGNVDLANVNVSDTLHINGEKADASVTWGTWEVTDGVTVTGNVISLLAVNDTATVTVSYLVPEGSQGDKIANVAVAENDEAEDETDPTDPVEVEKSPGLTVTKSVNKTTARVGDELIYTIVVENTGDTVLTNIKVVDAMLGYEDTITSLEPEKGMKYEITYTVTKADAGKTLVNTAVATAEDGTTDQDDSEGTNIKKPHPVNPPELNKEDHYSYIIGYPDGNVKPEGQITRAEVATIFFRLLTDESRTEFWSTTNAYSDVRADQWFNNAISTLSNAGILDGYNDGTFRPNAPITRAEFAKIAVSFFAYADEEYKALYPDVPEGKWYAQYVEAATELGLINGYPDGTFRPDKTITRAEACTIVNRTIERHPHEDQLHDDMIVWPDNPAPGEAGHEWYYEQIQEATNSHEYVMKNAFEDWTDLLENRDWAAFEKMWSDANSAPGGDVMK